MNSNSATEQHRYMMQWIVSLAISVVCCAVLFFVFALYILNVHDKTLLANIRLEVLQDRHQQVSAKVEAINHVLPPLIRTATIAAQQLAVSRNAAGAPASIGGDPDQKTPSSSATVEPVEPIPAPSATPAAPPGAPTPVPPVPKALSIQLPENAPTDK